MLECDGNSACNRLASYQSCIIDKDLLARRDVRLSLFHHSKKPFGLPITFRGEDIRIQDQSTTWYTLIRPRPGVQYADDANIAESAFVGLAGSAYSSAYPGCRQLFGIHPIHRHLLFFRLEFHINTFSDKEDICKT